MTALHISLTAIIFINKFLYTTLMHSITKMRGLEVPELESIEEYRKKSPQQRERYSEMKIKEMITKNTEKGVTISQIEKNTYFHRNTISKHIKSLINKGEVYQYPPDAPNGLLFSNGNLLDPIFKENITIDNKLFSIYIIKNQLGKFFYIQEKKENLYGQIETKGGLVIPLDQITNFSKSLGEITNKLVKRGIIKNDILSHPEGWSFPED